MKYLLLNNVITSNTKLAVQEAIKYAFSTDPRDIRYDSIASINLEVITNNLSERDIIIDERIRKLVEKLNTIYTNSTISVISNTITPTKVDVILKVNDLIINIEV